jgi:DNA helicase-2/ATP-dependent DNA helicase PcrA
LAGYAGLQPSFTIYDTDDQLRVIQRVMKALNIADATIKPKEFANFIDRAKNRGMGPDEPRLREMGDGWGQRRALEVYAAYEKEMRLANAVDFGDLILLPAQVLARNPEVCQNLSRRFRYVLVDEYQDTNFAQNELLKLLCSVHGNLCVVGDDDQSIYSWRGAEVGNILGFPDAWPGAQVVKLERNYRSTETILKASTALVSRNTLRHGKVLWTEAGMGDPVTLHVATTDRDEADWVARQIDLRRQQTPLKEFAVFYRTNACSRVLEESMRRYRLPYVLIGGMKFYERAEVKDALAWCRLLVNPSDSSAWLRAVVSPRRGIGDTTLELVQRHASLREVSIPAAAADLVRSGEAGRSAEKLREFGRVVQAMRDGIEDLRADEAGRRVLDQSGLKKSLQDDKDPDARDRLENLQQLLAAMAEYAESAEDPSLRGFLENVALVSDIDKLGEGPEKVSLMTMHAAKGLEFDVAFVVGLEEDLLPHANVVQAAGRDERALEEERRLFYVAMTRARKKLHLSHARVRRRVDGRELPSSPSRFLGQVPRELIQIDASGAWRSGNSWGQGWSAPRSQVGGWGGQPAHGDGERPAAMGYGAPARGGGHGSDDVPVIDRGGGTESGFVRGGRASHVRFGIGLVQDISGYGAEAQITVQFPQIGVKKIVARFLRPA